MLKYLYRHIDWEHIDVIGFDLDGTLYDEAEFIAQVYEPIAAHLAHVCDSRLSEIYTAIFKRWLEKGSSYNRIFSEQLEKFGIEGVEAQQAISECLTLYRNFKPILTLPARVKLLLNLCHQKYSIFLVSDGSAALQMAKINALNLEHWFEPNDIGLTGLYDSQFAKPSTYILSKIDAVGGISKQRVVFFGDRSCDQQFAAAAGFQYVEVDVLFPRRI